MAGGSGTRLWPASSSRLPKQFLPASGKLSFFSLALERALLCAQRIIIIAGESHIPHVIKDASKLTAAQKKRLIIIGEPEAKNTAAAIACGVVYSSVTEKSGSSALSGNMLVLTSDHIIKPLDIFKTDAAIAEEVCADKLVVFGITPEHPETGYGYVEVDPKSEKNSVFTVAAFHEKPDFHTAKKYISKKNFFWNSGMFAFNISFMNEQFRIYAPDVIGPFEKLKEPKPEDFSVSNGIKILSVKSSGWKGLKAAYGKVKSISFDYAIAEKCDKTAMIRANFDWVDIGNWEEYIKLEKGEIDKNNSQVFSADSETCYVDSDIPVALAGVDDLIVIIRSGKNGESASALITKKGKTQKVRDVVEIIKNSERKDLL